MAKFFLETLVIGQYYDKNLLVDKKYVDQELEMISPEFYCSGKTGLLFVEVQSDPSKFLTHFPSKKTFLWLSTTVDIKFLNWFEIYAKTTDNKIFLFAKIGGSELYLFLGGVEQETLKRGGAPPGSSSFQKEAFFWELNLEIDGKSWQVVGWMPSENMFIDKFRIPLRLQEVIMDNAWGPFLKQLQSKTRYFPYFLYLMKSSTLLVKLLYETGSYDDHLFSLEKDGEENDTKKIDVNKQVCIGRFKDNFVLLDYRVRLNQPPTIALLFGLNRRIADSVEDLERIIQQRGVLVFDSEMPS